MTANLRSLLIAAILLSNCITWTASRHHFSHNVHGHRSRHRRQGAGLYLPSSYVIPGGEGQNEGWGPWRDVSPCSRTCGGGVASRKRICLQFGEDGAPICRGGDTMYFSCQTQDCPEDSTDFRAVQCAEFNDKEFRGVLYNWVPYTRAVNPCELNCMPRGERFYYRHKPKVIDGTRCNEESYDVCVAGSCQHVGCDMMLGSAAREDKCRKCRGNGTNCYTNEGLIDMELTVGYNDILVIPAGAMTIVIEEIKPTNNYLALRNSNGTFYLNGYYRIDFPRNLIIAGAVWTYESSHTDRAAPDKLRSLGPTNETLYLSLLLQGKNTGVRYEYSLPSDQVTPTDKRYNWVHDDFTPCSASCGGGIQTRNVTCRTSEELEVVDDNLCEEVLKPATNQSCNDVACPAEWIIEPWGECSERCGPGGERKRDVTCQKVIIKGLMSLVADKECIDRYGPKPLESEKCNTDAPCPTWFIGRWKPCDKLCDEGQQTRQVVCHQKKDGRVEILDDIDCEDEKPETEKPCLLALCNGVDWVTSQWFGCDTCTSRNRTREVLCVGRIGGKVVNDSLCKNHPKPSTEEECDKDKLPKCEVRWYADQWSKCSVECGKGVKTRKVFCGLYDGESVQEVDDEKCANETKYNDTKPCEVPQDKCPSQYYLSAWSECSAKCGGGVQVSTPICLRGGQPASDCVSLPDTTRLCNQQPCNIDQLMPVDSKSPPIVDESDLPDCEDEDYPEEVGIEVNTQFTVAGMLSDSPYTKSYAEAESSLVDETGSGFGSTLTTNDYEASGDSSLSSEGFIGSTPQFDIDYTDFNESGSGDTGTPNFSDTTTTSNETDATETTIIDSNMTSTVTDSIESNTTEVSTTSGSSVSTETTIRDENATSSGIVTTESNVTDENSTFTATDSTESNTTNAITISGSTVPTEITTRDENTTSSGTVPTEPTNSDENSTSTVVDSTESNTTDASTVSGDSVSTEMATIDENATSSGSITTEPTITDYNSTSTVMNSTESNTTDVSTISESTVSIETTTKDENVTSSGTVTSESTTADENLTSTVTDSTESNTTDSSTVSESTVSTETTTIDENATSSGTVTTGSTVSDENSTSTMTDSTESNTTDASTIPGGTVSTETTTIDENATTSLLVTTEPTVTDDNSTSTVMSSTESNTTDVSTISDSTVNTETTTRDENATSSGTVTTESTISDENSTSTITDYTDSNITNATTISESTISSVSTTDEENVTVTTVTTIADENSTSVVTNSTESNTTDISTISGSTVSTETTIRDENATSSGTITTESNVTDENSTFTATDSTEFNTTDASTISGSTVSTEITTRDENATSSGIVTTESTISDENSTSTLTDSIESNTTDASTVSGDTVSTETATIDENATSIGTITTEPTIMDNNSTSTVMNSTESNTTDVSTISESTVSTETTTKDENVTSSGTVTSESTTTDENLTSTVTDSTESNTTDSSTISGSTVSTETSTRDENATTSVTVTTEPTIMDENSTSTVTDSTESNATDVSTTFGSTASTESTGSETTIANLTSSAETTGSTSESTSTESIVPLTTPVMPIFTSRVQPVCKPRKKKHCKNTKFGCCPDKIKPAKGPFEEGCNPPRTCKEADHGCCPDGVTAAQGPNNEGCPITPCEEELFGCCLSDNKTAAQGNDQEGCPPPPPACASSKYGCCADEETEATGPDSAGCPESETSPIETSTVSMTAETENYTSTQSSATDTTTYFSIDTSTQNVTETTMETNTMIETTTESETSMSSEGTTSIPTSTIKEGCAGSEFGCCYDNETEALGPNEQGCPCNATEFGCCPDGTPAQGEDNAGCQGPCSVTAHGCCQDNETPAHGPDYEGCCLNSPFGCCPDNRKPAEGPHMEGCGCQHSQHGCCPDNVTSALGPHNEGCGCQYTEFGCCPDRHTAASGPANKGCGCHTFQFGCCPDGVTAAQGPQKQGCHCQYSKYGCCSDEQTPAEGPNSSGCDCDASKYGCCPDGLTEAAGPNFLGCTDVPEDKQAVCSLPSNQGPCFNFTMMWFFDQTYGGCSRFWYGGCEGNGNRFATKEDCEDICVRPDPKDACKLADVRGPCDGSNIKWYYNSTREQCMQFRYGGCLGNANNFDTRELCQKQCEPERSTDLCDMPLEEGPCAGNFSRWGFNSESRRCEQFTWGGCEGNSNRFKTEAACEMRCNPPGVQKPECSDSQEIGNCTDKEALWSFSQSENRCVPFYYSGCGGNRNRFNSKETCEQFCPSAYVPGKCMLPAEIGECAVYRTNWFYDTTIKRCRTFYYGGCGGNENNFVSERECEDACTELVTTTTTSTPQTPKIESRGPVQPPSPDTAFCFYNIDEGGRCSLAKEETRYGYDSKLGKCVTFQYFGCGGNQNNFPTEEHCTYYCHQVQDICQLPMMSGPCDESIMSWFYDPTTDSCSLFTYGGCEGNANRFDSQEACESRCKTGTPVQTTQTTTVSSLTLTTIDHSMLDQIPIQCRISPVLEECQSTGLVWFFSPMERICLPYVNQNSGQACRHTATFNTQEGCERQCGAFRDIDTSVCSLQPEQGDCNARFKQWYYDMRGGVCLTFIYTGCNGNGNRFETRQDCEARCGALTTLSTTTLSVPIATPEPQREECTTPSSLAPCGRNRTVFYYDSSTKNCLRGEFGECGHPNSYRSEEECERQCGAFRDVNVCQARLDPGHCRNPVEKFYFDSITGRCQPFTYSGCAGGPNRFSSAQECEEICGDSGPETNEVDCDAYEQACAALLCDYGFVRSPAPGGCTACSCVDQATHCLPYTQACDALICAYGINRVQEGPCERCTCEEDPCSSANCMAKELCVSTAYTDLQTQEQKFTARCVPNNDVNEIPTDCSRQQEACKNLVCEFSKQYIRTADGCERCECVTVEVNCTLPEEDCRNLKCTYGMESDTGPEGCMRCKCKEGPCAGINCNEGERCVVDHYRDPLTQEPKYSGECRQVTKPGDCPTDNNPYEAQCRYECDDDAGCRGIGKCCKQGCSALCVAPVAPTTRLPSVLTTTYAPNLPAPPQALPPPEPEVAAAEGGKATLRCLFHGNPPPKITWRRGEITIDGNIGRYRLLSNGALEIVSLYRNDTGVYICVASNDLGTATQEVNLVVNDPVDTPAGIAGNENAVVTGELNKPLQLTCMAYGYPPPDVRWEHRGFLVPFNDAIYEARGSYLLIRRLATDTLGQYTCQAYNGFGKAATWIVSVRAYRPEDYFVEHEYLVPRHSVPSYLPTVPPVTTTRKIIPTTRSTTTTTERIRVFTVPVNTHVTTTNQILNIGASLRINCEVDGFPEPNVHWTKDGAVIEPDDRISITGSTVISRLVVSHVNVSDSGLYSCSADNEYTSHTDSIQINVQQVIVPAKCVDNPFFANCGLIVRHNYCQHQYYSKFCCKSCVEAGLLDPRTAELQADQPYRKK